MAQTRARTLNALVQNTVVNARTATKKAPKTRGATKAAKSAAAAKGAATRKRRSHLSSPAERAANAGHPCTTKKKDGRARIINPKGRCVLVGSTDNVHARRRAASQCDPHVRVRKDGKIHTVHMIPNPERALTGKGRFCVKAGGRTAKDMLLHAKFGDNFRNKTLTQKHEFLKSKAAELCDPLTQTYKLRTVGPKGIVGKTEYAGEKVGRCVQLKGVAKPCTEGQFKYEKIVTPKSGVLAGKTHTTYRCSASDLTTSGWSRIPGSKGTLPARASFIGGALGFNKKTRNNNRAAAKTNPDHIRAHKRQWRHVSPEAPKKKKAAAKKKGPAPTKANADCASGRRYLSGKCAPVKK